MRSHRQEVLLGLLSLMRAGGGRVENRIRIQKEAFLLSVVGASHFDPVDFVFHYYGPYSRTLSDVLHQAVSLRLVEETREDFADEGKRYSYQLTKAGNDLLDAGIVSVNENIDTLVPQLRRRHWRALELGATVVFLEHSLRINRDEAFEEAIKLKPACANYVKDAKQVLNTVGI
jgi:uncharacterized protein